MNAVLSWNQKSKKMMDPLVENRLLMIPVMIAVNFGKMRVEMEEEEMCMMMMLMMVADDDFLPLDDFSWINVHSHSNCI